MLSNAAGNKKPLDMRGYFASNPNGMYEAIQDPANFPDLFQSLNRDKERCNLKMWIACRLPAIIHFNPLIGM